LDKIFKGTGAIGDVSGAGVVADPVKNDGVSLDGTPTNDAANAGAQINNKETSMLESAGSAVPKVRRQFDKISKGAGAIGDATGAGVMADPVANESASLDGTFTSDADGLGVQVGSIEASTLESAGSAVPKTRRQLDISPKVLKRW